MLSKIQALFRFVTCALVAALLYLIYMDYLVYKAQHLTKPESLIDLPKFE